jgi:hypothetical protein
MAMADETVSIPTASNNLVNRVELSELEDVHRDKHCGLGLFLEAQCEKLDKMAGFLKRKDQTLVVHGFSRDEIADFLTGNRVKGIDRVVSPGHALDFSVKWDGFDLLRDFCREVDIVV